MAIVIESRTAPQEVSAESLFRAGLNPQMWPHESKTFSIIPQEKNIMREGSIVEMGVTLPTMNETFPAEVKQCRLGRTVLICGGVEKIFETDLELELEELDSGITIANYRLKADLLSDGGLTKKTKEAAAKRMLAPDVHNFAGKLINRLAAACNNAEKRQAA